MGDILTVHQLYPGPVVKAVEPEQILQSIFHQEKIAVSKLCNVKQDDNTFNLICFRVKIFGLTGHFDRRLGSCATVYSQSLGISD